MDSLTFLTLTRRTTTMNSEPVTIGVLALQGAFEEHQRCLESLSPLIRTKQIRTPDQLANIDGIILPGGESTGKFCFILFIQLHFALALLPALWMVTREFVINAHYWNYRPMELQMHRGPAFDFCIFS
jgi:hypothetical protein